MKIYEYEFFKHRNKTYVDEEITSEVSIKCHFNVYWFGDNFDHICNIENLNTILNFNYFRCLKKLSKNQLNKLRVIYGKECLFLKKESM